MRENFRKMGIARGVHVHPRDRKCYKKGVKNMHLEPEIKFDKVKP